MATIRPYIFRLHSCPERLEKHCQDFLWVYDIGNRHAQSPWRMTEIPFCKIACGDYRIEEFGGHRPTRSAQLYYGWRSSPPSAGATRPCGAHANQTAWPVQLEPAAERHHSVHWHYNAECCMQSKETDKSCPRIFRAFDVFEQPLPAGIRSQVLGSKNRGYCSEWAYRTQGPQRFS
jgi:hypothetical protein